MMPPAVAPFWRAVLGGYIDRDDEFDLIDPHWRQPAVNFGQMDVPRPQRNRVHINLYVPLTRLSPGSERHLLPVGTSSRISSPRTGGCSPTPKVMKSASPRSVGKAEFPPS